MKFKTGQIVKINDRFARALSKARSCTANKPGRTGTVVRCNAGDVIVLWYGRKFPEYLPHKAVELVTA
jgi:hypothetical protein